MQIEEGGRSYWLAPVEDIELDSQPLVHEVADLWPEEDRYARTFWFTLEHPYLNGTLTSASGGEELAYRSFLVPEMGHDLRAVAVTDAKNDSFLGRPEGVEEIPGGTLRFYARVEIASTSHRVKPLQMAASLDEQQLLNPALPVIYRSADLSEPLHPVAGELLQLPAFTAESSDGGTAPEPVRERLAIAVEQRAVATSEAFAAMLVSGRPQLADEQLHSLGEVRLDNGQLKRSRIVLRWHQDVQTGDLLRTGGHWLVLESDDGNGLLDEADRVLHCWREPAVAAVLSKALTEEETTFQLLRHVPISAP
jgi:hypothetical protein